MKKEFTVSGMSCVACERHVKQAVCKVKGVQNVQVSLLQNKMTVFLEEGTPISQILKAVEQAGYKAFPLGETDKDKIVPTSKLSEKTRLIFSFLSLLPLVVFAMFFDNKVSLFQSAMWQVISGEILSFLFLIPILILNHKILKKGFVSLVRKMPTMDSLIAVGVSASIVSGLVLFITTLLVKENLGTDYIYFESAGMILCFVSLGKFLEGKAKKNTNKALNALQSLIPQEVTVLAGDKKKKIPFGNLKNTDIIVVCAGEHIPVDGKVISGDGETDESPLTGESLPQEKSIGNTVYAGTLLTSGYIEIEIVTIGKNTFLGNIISLVEDASATKAPIARLADKISAIFVPTILLLSVCTFVIWMVCGYGFSFSVTMAIAVLVVSCPCALGLATPTAIMVGIGEGAKQGILFKSAQALEIVDKSTVMVWDKTGTLTTGKMQVAKLIPADGYNEIELLNLAATIEQVSKHPFAKAIMEYADKQNIVITEKVTAEYISGRGLIASYPQGKALAGNYNLFASNNISIPSYELLLAQAVKEGCSLLLFAKNSQYVGCIFFKDTIREGAKELIDFLNTKGIKSSLLTGDNKQVALQVAKEVGIQQVFAEVLPQEKAKVINDLQQKGEKVIMIGDGINDSPSLACADVGISVASGTDVAVNMADIVLMTDDLKKVKNLFALSHKVIKHIKQNLFWAFAYNIVLIPVAAGALYIPFGWKFSPMLAAVAMSFSSVCVVSNSLRIRSKEIYIKENSMKKTMIIEGMMCAHCANHVEEALLGVKGVSKVQVNLAQKQAIIEVTEAVENESLIQAVTKAGYQVKSCK